MNDTMFLIFGLILVFTLISCFVAYKIITESIIKDQEREIAKLKTENKRLNGDYARKSAELAKLKSIQPVKMQAIEIVDRQFIDALGEKDKETFYKSLRHSLYYKFEESLQKLISVERDKELDTYCGAAFRASLELWVDTSKVNNYYEDF
jgi:hypothetical protein